MKISGLRISFVLISAFLLFSGGAANDGAKGIAKELQLGISKVIVVKGDDQFLPFEYVNANGEPDGFNVELFKTLMKRLGFKYTLKLDDWSKVQSELAEKRIDMVIGMLYSPERAKEVRFGVPHSMINYCVVSRKNNEYFGLGELKGKKLIVQKNDRSNEYIIENKISSDIIQSETIVDGLELLSSGVGDAFLSFDITALYYIKQLHLSNLIIHQLDISPERYSFAVNTDNEDLLYVLNMGMQQMKIDGEYDKIYYKWFGIYAKNNMPLYIKIIMAFIVLAVLMCGLFIWLLRIGVRRAIEDLRHKNEEQSLLVDELKASKFRDEESDKLKSAFLANMSHEIRTPLNAVVGFSNLMSMEDCSKEDMEAYKDIIKVNSDMLLRLVSDILDLSKIESNTLSFSLTRVPIKSICDNAYASVCCARKEEGSVEVLNRSYFNCIVNTDPNRLNQVIINLKNNALKYTSSGSVVIETRQCDNNMVEVSISDTGKGIPDYELSNIFNRFTKLDSFAQGSGIGLAISKSIIEMLGGEIGVESELGKGSKFWFKLPIFGLME